jgi:hypothetical protein
MTACVNCSRALQPAWKYCIFCGTRTAVAATAQRARPIPKRTPVPGYAAATGQTPIVPVAAPAPLAAAPSEEPVSSIWPETMGERPSLRSAIAATEIPAPTPPRDEELPEPEDLDDVDDVEDEQLPEPEGSGLSIADLAHELDEDPEDEPEPEPEDEAESGPDADRLDIEPLPARRWGRRAGRPAGGTLLEEAPELEDTELDEAEYDDEAEFDDEAAPRDRTGSVNTLAILALLIGILACPFAALFGHLALGQLKVSGERGVVPAWIAVVLGYLWLGFWIVFGVTYLATNG